MVGGLADEALEELARRVDAAADGATTALAIRDRLGITPDDKDTPVAALDVAFSYYERHDGSGYNYFGPLFEVGGQSFPPLPDDTPDEIQAVWEALAEKVHDPAARARLHDLCFVTGRGSRRDHARAAAQAYLEVAARYPRMSAEKMDALHVALGATESVTRALDLARRTGQEELAKRVIAVAIDLARRALEDPEAGPGVILGFFRPIVSDRDCPAEVDELLDLARDRYRTDVWNTMSTIQVQLARPGVDAPRREALRRQQVEAYLRAADDVAPMVAMLHLQDAAKIAEDYRLDDLRRTVMERLQRIQPEDLGLTRQEVSVEVDRAPIEEWFDSLVGHDTWQEAIVALLSAGPPTGQVEANHSMAAEIPSVAPFSTLLSRIRIGPDGLPRHRSEGGDPEELLAEVETNRLQVTGPLVAEALRRILEKWSPLDEEEVAALLGQHDHVPDEVARALGTSMARLGAGDHDAAAFTALPKVERIAREMVRAMGEPVFRPPSPTAPAMFVGLGNLVEILESHGLDPSWARSTSHSWQAIEA